jgi:hypothetical protein
MVAIVAAAQPAGAIDNWVSGRIDSIRSRLTGAINRQHALLGYVSIDLVDPRLALPPD